MKNSDQHSIDDLSAEYRTASLETLPEGLQCLAVGLIKKRFNLNLDNVVIANGVSRQQNYNGLMIQPDSDTNYSPRRINVVITHELNGVGIHQSSFRAVEGEDTKRHIIMARGKAMQYFWGQGWHWDDWELECTKVEIK